MKQKDKDALKQFFGEAGVQAAGVLIVGALGGVGLAYIFIGWGVLLLLFPFGILAYWAFRKRS
ncbi:hypothetical protein ACNFD4_21510 [Pseudomonas sp. NY15367]